MAVRQGSEQGQHAAEQQQADVRAGSSTLCGSQYTRGAGKVMGLEGDDPSDAQVEHPFVLEHVVHLFVLEQYDGESRCARAASW